MTQRIASLLLVVAVAGCQKEQAGSEGGAAGGAGALDYPADTTALVGFSRKGPAPTAAQLTGAMKALLGEEPDKEIVQLIDACIAPVSAHLERTTVIVRGSLRDERVVVMASGPGLRAALEACLKTMEEQRGKSFAPPTTDGDYTLYQLGGGDPMVARWTGTDRVVVSDEKAEIESATGAAGGLRGTPLEEVAGEVDRSSAMWFAAAGPNLPPEANIERASGTVQDLTGAARVVFKTPEAASQASGLIQTVIPKGVKVNGKEVTVGLNVADLPAIMISGKPGTPPTAPLSQEHARALVAAGPLVLAFLLVAGDSDEASPPPEPVEAVPAPAPEVAPPPP